MRASATSCSGRRPRCWTRLEAAAGRALPPGRHRRARSSPPFRHAVRRRERPRSPRRSSRLGRRHRLGRPRPAQAGRVAEPQRRPVRARGRPGRGCGLRLPGRDEAAGARRGCRTPASSGCTGCMSEPRRLARRYATTNTEFMAGAGVAITSEYGRAARRILGARAGRGDAQAVTADDPRRPPAGGRVVVARDAALDGRGRRGGGGARGALAAARARGGRARGRRHLHGRDRPPPARRGAGGAA